MRKMEEEYSSAVETPPSSSAVSIDWSDNASWRTCYSSVVENGEYVYPRKFANIGESNYLWESMDAHALRSLSSISVMTAEPIEYDCSKEVIECDPSEMSFTQSSSCSSSVGPLTPKHFHSGTASLAGGDFHHYTHHELVEVESAIHQIRLQKDPPSYYHVIGLNRGPIDMVPRLSNVPSQYQLQDMYEFSALQASNTLGKQHHLGSWPKIMNGGGDADGYIHEADSQYCSEAP